MKAVFSSTRGYQVVMNNCADKMPERENAPIR
jgi:hypothetical protein